MSTQSIAQRLQRYAKQTHGEAAIAATIGEFISPLHSEAETLAKLNTLLDSMPAVTTVDAVCEWLKSLGFGHAVAQPVNRQHSDLAWVLEHQAGLPICCAVIVMSAARRAGFEAVGLNHPGHFLVRINDSVVDPVQMRSLDMRDFTSTDEASPLTLGLRMLNNLKALNLQTADLVGALDVVDLQLALATDIADSIQVASLHFERGEFWSRLGAWQSAREAFRRCLDYNPPDDLENEVLARIEELSGRTEVRH